MAAWTDGIVTANGIDIHYLRTGGDKPPVVLLHGLTDNGACWTHLARDLEGAYDLIMPDARGHGRSSVPERGYSFADHSADLISLIGALALDRPALIGHSMGGMTCAMAAAQAPALIRGAMLEDPAFVPADGWGERSDGDWPRQHSAVLATSIETLVAEGRASNPLWAPDTFELWAQAKHETSMRAFDLFHRPGPAFRTLIAQTVVPILLVTGDPERGVVVPPATAAELQALNPRLRVANLAGAGHCIRYEQPERFAALARDFLGELFA